MDKSMISVTCTLTKIVLLNELHKKVSDIIKKHCIYIEQTRFAKPQREQEKNNLLFKPFTFSDWGIFIITGSQDLSLCHHPYYIPSFLISELRRQ